MRRGLNFMPPWARVTSLSAKWMQPWKSSSSYCQLDHSARSYTYMGLCQRHLGKLDAAKDYLNLGLKLDPVTQSYFFNLGVIAKKQQEQAQAEQYLRQLSR